MKNHVVAKQQEQQKYHDKIEGPRLELGPRTASTCQELAQFGTWNDPSQGWTSIIPSGGRQSGLEAARGPVLGLRRALCSVG